MKLAIINSCPIEKYIELGYTWVFDYYNPCHIFDEIFYYAYGTSDMDNFYKKDFAIHTRIIKSVEEISNELIANKVDVIRNYEAGVAEMAIEISKKANIPIIVSVH